MRPRRGRRRSCGIARSDDGSSGSVRASGSWRVDRRGRGTAVRHRSPQVRRAHARRALPGEGRRAPAGLADGAGPLGIVEQAGDGAADSERRRSRGSTSRPASGRHRAPRRVDAAPTSLHRSRRCRRRRDDRGALGHGLEHRQAEAFAHGSGSRTPRRRRTTRPRSAAGRTRRDAPDPPGAAASSRASSSFQPSGPPSTRSTSVAPEALRRPRAARAGSCGARWCRSRARTGESRPCSVPAAAGAPASPAGRARRRSPTAPVAAGDASKPWCDAVRASSPRDGHTTTSASRLGQLDRPVEEPDPVRRERASGSCTKARSWTVTTRGADFGGMAMPVTWITSTGPVARSTFGRRNRCHDS